MPRRVHRYNCPTCGGEVSSDAAWRARIRQPCLACTRTANGWKCRVCDSADPQHPAPCPVIAGHWEPVRSSGSRRGIVYWRWVTEQRPRGLGSISRQDAAGMVAYRDADAVAWRALRYRYDERGRMIYPAVSLGTFPTRRAAEAAVLAALELAVPARNLTREDQP